MGKSTISMVIFNSYVTNYQRVDPCRILPKTRLLAWCREISCGIGRVGLTRLTLGRPKIFVSPFQTGDESKVRYRFHGVNNKHIVSSVVPVRTYKYDIIDNCQCGLLGPSS